MHVKTEKAAVATGIGGLDNILGGGFTPNRIYLIEGDPGSGKTTLALQYLLEGRRQGESGMYVSLSETKEELEGVARDVVPGIVRRLLFELIDQELELILGDRADSRARVLVEQVNHAEVSTGRRGWEIVV